MSIATTAALMLQVGAVFPSTPMPLIEQQSPVAVSGPVLPQQGARQANVPNTAAARPSAGTGSPVFPSRPGQASDSQGRAVAPDEPARYGSFDEMIEASKQNLIDTPVLRRSEPMPIGMSDRDALRWRAEQAASRNRSSVTGETGIRNRTGSSGTSRLREIGAGGEGSIPITPKLSATAGFRAISVASGQPDVQTLREMGSNPIERMKAAIDQRPPAYGQMGGAVRGIEASAGIRGDNFEARVGVTPIGFRETSPTVEVSARPRIGQTEIRISATHLPVEESVLSWSGIRDPLTGIEWGGVMQTRAAIGFATLRNRLGFYADVGYALYRGKNVLDNEALDAGGGIFYRLIDENDSRLQIGSHIQYMAFDRNLRHFTIGHGGYFSPQSFLTVSLPIEWSNAGERYRIRMAASPGYQTWSEEGNELFPGNPFSLQDQALALSQQIPGLVPTGYAPKSQSGFGITAAVNGEYLIARRTAVGLNASLDTYGIFRELTAKAYLTHEFGGRQ